MNPQTEQWIQFIEWCIAKGISPGEAREHIRKSIQTEEVQRDPNQAELPLGVEKL